MDLRAWRKAHSRTLADVARVLGITGKNPSRTVQRYETGAARIDLGTAAAITVMSGGAVTFEDLCRVRREHLSAADVEKDVA